ncbi:hypothetical protein Tco_0505499 [Tanacetum coccineum]
MLSLINGSGDIGSSNGPKRVGGKACWGEGTRNEVSDQHSYCFNVEDDPKTFDEEMKSHDAAFWKEAIMMDGFQIDESVSTLIDTSEKLMPNNGQTVSQLEYSRVIGCLIAATMVKAYSQMYNGKSRHLGVKHSMIHELITNGVVSIEFVRSQQNLVDYLTKGLARDFLLKSFEGFSSISLIVVVAVVFFGSWGFERWKKLTRLTRDGKPMMPIHQVQFGGAKPVTQVVPEVRATQVQSEDDSHVHDE